jgi:hypothetical protein
MIEINGVKYEARPQQSNVRTNKHVAAAALMAMASYGSSHYDRKLSSNISIIKEFEMIQQKKSKLSKWEREQVVRTFNNHFRKIEL